MVPDRLWYCTDCVVRGYPFSHSHVPLGQLPSRSSVISGELKARGNSICLCSTGALS